MGYRNAVLSVVILGLVGAGGCGTIGRGTTESTRFYVLHSTDSSAPTPDGAPATKELTVAVGPVSIASYLKRPHIVTLGDGNEVHLADFARWAEDLEEGVGRVLAENLSIFLGTDRVIADYPSDTDGARYGVTVKVIRFDGHLDGNVLLTAWWSIVDTGSGAALNSRRSVHRRAVEGVGYGALVAAENGALEDFSREIAAVLVDIHRKQSPAGSSLGK